MRGTTAQSARKEAWFHTTEYGKIFNGDSYLFISRLRDNSVDLIVTSPPFGLVRKKEYGNVPADEYLDWLRPYATQFHRVLKTSGSLVIDIGGVWNKGEPTRHLYHFELLIMFCKEYDFHLAQDFYWWNPAKLPTPAEWVTVRRIRVKDAVNKVWWLSKSPWPKASNKRVLQPYSASMRNLLKNGYKSRLRPSGHDISDRFGADNGAAIPPNLLAIANTESNSPYLRYCRDRGLKPHPARFPAELPEFFVRMLTDEGDNVLDPFAGSCATGEICERLKRNWTCVELRADYLESALGRFDADYVAPEGNDRHDNCTGPKPPKDSDFYKLPRVGVLWNGATEGTLATSGGQRRNQNTNIGRQMSSQIESPDTSTFLGNLSVLNLKTEYRSIKEDPVTDFYGPCLLNAIRYKRAVGYFRSTVYHVIGTAVVEFARRGGRTELICSPELSDEDVDSIALGYARKSELVGARLFQQIEALLASEDTVYNTRVLATLISVGALEIKVAVRADRKGPYHEKIGVFSDGMHNAVSFKGSANETWSGWHPQGNFESVEVFCSWRGGLEADRVKKHTAHFDALWAEHDPDIEVFSFPADAVTHLKKAAFEGLDAVDPRPVPAPGKHRTPLPHQAAAVHAWLSRSGRGIFEHATGSGKTFTALMAVHQHIALGKPALVLVPSRLLLEQWASEIRQELPRAALLLAGGGNNAWKAPHRLRGMTAADTAHGSRIVLATMQTASMDGFRDAVIDGDHLLLVADEVHRIGSRQHERIMKLDAGFRLGLSATPVRYGDPEGTRRIFDYFGDVVPPPLRLQDAIATGRLVPYEYFPHPLNLTAEEAERWRKYTDKIRREIARQKPDDGGAPLLSDKVKLLLIQRSRVAKKASAKVRLACAVLREHFEKGQGWLVYCEDADQLMQVLAALRQEGMDPVEYHSRMAGDRLATMSWFRSFGGILVSIRCLDEGVDIPAVSHALILASSQNPRQFIQRRGRVLRRAPGKHVAVVHDAVVAPVSADDEPEQLSLLKSELVRTIEFADHAINKGAGAALRDIAIGMGIAPDGLRDGGVEDDENEEDA